MLQIIGSRLLDGGQTHIIDKVGSWNDAVKADPSAAIPASAIRRCSRPMRQAPANAVTRGCVNLAECNQFDHEKAMHRVNLDFFFRFGSEIAQNPTKQEMSWFYLPSRLRPKHLRHYRRF
jgi:hypothetical protein